MMPRPTRADEAGGLYHALNHGNLPAEVFHKDADFAAVERILHKDEGLQIHKLQLFSYQLMPNHCGQSGGLALGIALALAAIDRA